MARIGIMSFAHMHAQSYAACINQIPGAALAAVWDTNARRGRLAARQFNTQFVGSLDKFLAMDIDAVIITSENVRHREMVERAAAAEKWILCEKPLATTIKDAKAMVAACEAAGVGLGTAFPCRYIEPVIAARNLILTGGHGPVYAAACTNNGQFPGGWFADEALAGGGATMDHTVHVADLLRWITGKEFTQVYCENGNLLHPRIKTDDLGCLHLEMEGGIRVSHVASWSRPKSFPTWGDVTLELVTAKGVIRVDGFNQNVNLYSDKAMKAQWVYWGSNPDLGLIADFAEAVDERRPPAITGIDGLRAVEVTVAACKSARTGRVVAI